MRRGDIFPGAGGGLLQPSLPQAVCCLRVYAVYVSFVLRLVITGIGFPLVWFLKQQQSAQVKQCFRYKQAKTTYSRGSGGYIIVISHN